MLQCIQNMQIIYAMASEQINLMLRLRKIGGRFRKKRLWMLVSKNSIKYCFQQTKQRFIIFRIAMAAFGSAMLKIWTIQRLNITSELAEVHLQKFVKKQKIWPRLIPI